MANDCREAKKGRAGPRTRRSMKSRATARVLKVLHLYLTARENVLLKNGTRLPITIRSPQAIEYWQPHAVPRHWQPESNRAPAWLVWPLFSYRKHDLSLIHI